MTVDFSLVIELNLYAISVMLATCGSRLINLPSGFSPGDYNTAGDAGYVICCGDFWRISTFNIEKEYLRDPRRQYRNHTYQTLKVNKILLINNELIGIFVLVYTAHLRTPPR